MGFPGTHVRQPQPSKFKLVKPHLKKLPCAAPVRATELVLVWFGFMAYGDGIGFGLVWFGLVLWHINHCWLFNAKSTFIPLIIIITSCWKHGYPWSSLATFPYRSSPLAGLLDNILSPHIVAECMFVLVVLLLHGHVWGSIRVHHLWVRPCISSSVLHVWFV